MKSLNELRKNIDEIDREIIELFEKRMDVAREIGRYKKQHDLPVFDPEREKKLIEKNSNYVQNPNYRESYRHLLLLMMEESKKIQK